MFGSETDKPQNRNVPKETVLSMDARLLNLEQRSRMTNIEVPGVPEADGEVCEDIVHDLAAAVGLRPQPGGIQVAHRVKTYPSERVKIDPLETDGEVCEVIVHDLVENPGVYSEINKSTEKLSSMARLLERERPLMTWQGGPEVGLDAGCGPGDVTALVLHQWLPVGSLVLGADVSRTMIDHANSSHGDPPRLAFAVADLASRQETRSLLEVDPVFAAGFTKIVSLFVLHWLHDLASGVSNFHHLLRPGGEALMAFPVDRLFMRTFSGMRSSQRWQQYFKGVDRRVPTVLKKDPATEFEEMLRRAGFEVVKCNVDYLYLQYDTIDKFKGLVESLDPDIDRIPVELKEVYLDECVKNFKTLGALTPLGNSFSFRQLFMTCVARKPKQQQIIS